MNIDRSSENKPFLSYSQSSDETKDSEGNEEIIRISNLNIVEDCASNSYVIRTPTEEMSGLSLSDDENEQRRHLFVPGGQTSNTLATRKDPGSKQESRKMEENNPPNTSDPITALVNNFHLHRGGYKTPELPVKQVVKSIYLPCSTPPWTSGLTVNRVSTTEIREENVTPLSSQSISLSGSVGYDRSRSFGANSSRKLDLPKPLVLRSNMDSTGSQPGLKPLDPLRSNSSEENRPSPSNSTAKLSLSSTDTQRPQLKRTSPYSVVSCASCNLLDASFSSTTSNQEECSVLPSLSSLVDSVFSRIRQSENRPSPFSLPPDIIKQTPMKPMDMDYKHYHDTILNLRPTASKCNSRRFYCSPPGPSSKELLNVSYSTCTGDSPALPQVTTRLFAPEASCLSPELTLPDPLFSMRIGPSAMESTMMFAQPSFPPLGTTFQEDSSKPLSHPRRMSEEQFISTLHINDREKQDTIHAIYHDLSKSTNWSPVVRFQRSDSIQSGCGVNEGELIDSSFRKNSQTLTHHRVASEEKESSTSTPSGDLKSFVSPTKTHSCSYSDSMLACKRSQNDRLKSPINNYMNKCSKHRKYSNDPPLKTYPLQDATNCKSPCSKLFSDNSLLSTEE